MTNWYERTTPLQLWLMQHGPFEYAVAFAIVIGTITVVLCCLFGESTCPHCGKKP